MQYDDAFTLQKVEDDYVQIFNYMAGMVPVIQKLITDVSREDLLQIVMYCGHMIISRDVLYCLLLICSL